MKRISCVALSVQKKHYMQTDYIHTHTHTHSHTDIHIHTYHRHSQTHTHTHSHTDIHIHTYPQALTDTHTSYPHRLVWVAHKSMQKLHS